MQNTSGHGTGVQNGLPRWEALELLPLPICLRNGVRVDVEHATDDEFTAWLHWNGIPFHGLSEWSFDSKCAIINHVLSNGLRPRLIGPIENCLEFVSQLFEVVDIPR